MVLLASKKFRNIVIAIISFVVVIINYTKKKFNLPD